MLNNEATKTFNKYANNTELSDYFDKFLTQLNSSQVFTVQYSDLNDANTSKINWWNNLFYLSDSQTNFKNYNAGKQKQMSKIIASILDDLNELN
ncbi:MAG: hypothetical protein HDT49_08580 [Lactobacillus sp.]|nr:hypothetical protein [Lactobacillus sp.]